jgi:hypothetical protein
VVLREAFLRHADRLLALALVLREAGNIKAAEKYVQRALECLDQANLDEQQEAKKEEAASR